MLGMAINSAKLFVTGKLFQDYSKVMRQMLIAVVVGIVLLVGVAQFAPIWLASAVGGAAAGFLQPVLFKDLKYA